MTDLTTQTLGELDIPVPGYDRDGLEAGVVHIGVGAFHRAHMAMFHDRLLAEGAGDGWAICGAGVLAADAGVRDALRAQDFLYTLTLKHADGTFEPRVIGSHVDYVDGADDPEPLLARIADPRTRIVSLTVTEGGWTTGNPTFDLLARALDRRRQEGGGPVTVMSCDNLEHNGRRAREVVLDRAQAVSQELSDWVQEEVAFPSSMVDRITPRTTDEDKAELLERFDVADKAPVVCEPFVQWVLEDAFAAGRPDYEAAGVQLVDDVEPYELLKLRLLNASHQALCYFAYLLGHRLVHEAAQDPLLHDLLDGYMEHEGAPTVPPVPGVDVADYRATLLERFANPQVRDTVARLCAESSARIPRWLVPVIRANLEAGGEVRRSAAVVASWTRYAEGTDEQGEPIEVVDEHAAALTERALASREDPLAFVRDAELFGDLADDPRFTDPYLEALDSLRRDGAKRTLERLLG